MKCFPVLGSAGRHQEIESQHGNSRYTDLIRLCFQQKWIASLGAVSTVLCTPCLKKLMILILNRVIATGLHTRTHTHRHTYTHTLGREHIHTFVASYMHTGIHIVHSHTHPPSHSSMHPSIRPYIHTYMLIYLGSYRFTIVYRYWWTNHLLSCMEVQMYIPYTCIMYMHSWVLPFVSGGPTPCTANNWETYILVT